MNNQQYDLINEKNTNTHDTIDDNIEQLNSHLENQELEKNTEEHSNSVLFIIFINQSR